MGAERSPMRRQIPAICRRAKTRSPGRGSQEKLAPVNDGRYRAKNPLASCSSVLEQCRRRLSSPHSVGLYRRRRYGRCPARACRPRRRPVNSGCRALPPTQARAPRLVCTYLPISNANRIQPRSATALSRLSRGQNNRPSSSSEGPGPLVIRGSAGSQVSRKSYSSHPPFDRAVAVFATLAGRVVNEGEVVGDLDEAAPDGDDHAGGGAQYSRHEVADESIRRSRCAVPLALDCCQRWRTTISRRSAAAVCAALE